jgi:hypothetical protein
MKKRLQYTLIFLSITSTVFFSCGKENYDEAGLFYGRWETNYGDTVMFSKPGRKNMLNYDASLNPAFAPRVNHEFTFINNKLGLKNGRNSNGSFYFFQSFRWLQQGWQFEVQGVDWFPFISSTQTYFTFTKIP